MSTITITLTQVCVSGGHLSFSITGAHSATVPMETVDMTTPISTEEIQSLVKLVSRLVKIDRSNAQARAVLEAGVVVGA